MNQSMPQVEMMTCNSCWQDKPATEFRRRRRGSEQRHHQCGKCFADYMRHYRQSRRKKEMSDFWRQVANPRSNPPLVLALCVRMIRQVGGPEALAKQWREDLAAARAKQPGSQAALRCYQTLFRLFETCARYQS